MKSTNSKRKGSFGSSKCRLEQIQDGSHAGKKDQNEELENDKDECVRTRQKAKMENERKKRKFCTNISNSDKRVALDLNNTRVNAPVVNTVGMNKLTCTTCGYSSSSKLRFDVHIMLHDHSFDSSMLLCVSKSPLCSDPIDNMNRDKNEASSIQATNSIDHKNEKPFRCLECPWSGELLAQLNCHMLRHFNEKELCSQSEIKAKSKSHESNRTLRNSKVKDSSLSSGIKSTSKHHPIKTSINLTRCDSQPIVSDLKEENLIIHPLTGSSESTVNSFENFKLNDSFSPNGIKATSKHHPIYTPTNLTINNSQPIANDRKKEKLRMHPLAGSSKSSIKKFENSKVEDSSLSTTIKATHHSIHTSTNSTRNDSQPVISGLKNEINLRMHTLTGSIKSKDNSFENSKLKDYSLPTGIKATSQHYPIHTSPNLTINDSRPIVSDSKEENLRTHTLKGSRKSTVNSFKNSKLKDSSSSSSDIKATSKHHPIYTSPNLPRTDSRPIVSDSKEENLRIHTLTGSSKSTVNSFENSKLKDSSSSSSDIKATSKHHPIYTSPNLTRKDSRPIVSDSKEEILRIHTLTGSSKSTVNSFENSKLKDSSSPSNLKATSKHHPIYTSPNLTRKDSRPIVSDSKEENLRIHTLTGSSKSTVNRFEHSNMKVSSSLSGINSTSKQSIHTLPIITRTDSRPIVSDSNEENLRIHTLKGLSKSTVDSFENSKLKDSSSPSVIKKDSRPIVSDSKEKNLRIHTLTGSSKSTVNNFEHSKLNDSSLPSDIKATSKHHPIHTLPIITRTDSRPIVSDLKEENLRIHTLTGSSKNKFNMFECTLCSFKTCFEVQIQSHMKSHKLETADNAKPQESLYLCELCPYTCASEDQLDIHISSHKEVNDPLICDQCGCKFDQQADFLEHNCEQELDINQPESQEPMGVNPDEVIEQLSYNQVEKWIEVEKESVQKSNKRDKEHNKNNKIKKKSKRSKGMKKTAGKEKCKLCGKIFTDINLLKQHLVSHLPAADRPFKCSQCSWRGNFHAQLVRHSLVHSGEKKFKCRLCDYRSVSKTYIRVHIRGKHGGVKPFMCAHCPYRSVFKHYLARHLLVHSGEKPFYCDKCERRFSQKVHLRVHRCKPTSQADSSSLIQEIQSSPPSPEFVLPGSGEFHSGNVECTSDPVNDKDSVKSNADDKRELCETCGKWFANRSLLSQHLRTHLKERPVKCSKCSWSGFKLCELKMHMLRHSEDRNFKCQLCDYRAKTKRNLNTHLIIHGGEKPFSCHQCSYRTAFKCSLMKHLDVHSGLKPFSCAQCGRKFSQKSHLTQHRCKLESPVIRLGENKNYHTRSKNYKNKTCKDSSQVPSVESPVIQLKEITNDGETVKYDENKICIDSSQVPSVESPVIQLKEITNDGETIKHDENKTCKDSSQVSSVESPMIQLGENTFNGATDKNDENTDESALEKCEDSSQTVSNLREQVDQTTSVDNITLIVNWRTLEVVEINRESVHNTGVPERKIIDRTHLCKSCGKRFLTNSDLSAHMVVHEDRPFRCKKCSRCFKRAKDLRGHIQIHSDIKWFDCPICDYKAKTKHNVVLHLRTHSDKKPFSCEFCSFRCRFKHQLKTHVLNHLEDKPFKCDQCAKAFHQEMHWTRHLQRHQEEKFNKKNERRHNAVEFNTIPPADVPGGSDIGEQEESAVDIDKVIIILPVDLPDGWDDENN